MSAPMADPVQDLMSRLLKGFEGDPMLDLEAESDSCPVSGWRARPDWGCVSHAPTDSASDP
jgi:hypothetical protein